MDKKKLIEIVRELDELGLTQKQRRHLIEECHSCVGKIYGFDKNLKNGINFAKDRKLKCGEAYEFLYKSTGKYVQQNKILSEDSNYPLWI